MIGTEIVRGKETTSTVNIGAKWTEIWIVGDIAAAMIFIDTNTIDGKCNTLITHFDETSSSNDLISLINVFRRSRSTSRHRERVTERIDKKRLLEIARKNAITMLKNGTLPGTHNMDPEAKEKALTKMRFGGA